MGLILRSSCAWASEAEIAQDLAQMGEVAESILREGIGRDPALLLALDNPVTRGRTYNIAMDEPVDYGALAAYLARTRGLGSVDVASGFHSVWLDNTRARLELGWRPVWDMARMVDAAFDHVRAPDDPRRVWYPG